MNIRELIEQLQALDPDLPVLVHGYERGFDLVRHLVAVEVVEVHIEKLGCFWHGQFVDVDEIRRRQADNKMFGEFAIPVKPGALPFKAVLLPRSS